MGGKMVDGFIKSLYNLAQSRYTTGQAYLPKGEAVLTAGLHTVSVDEIRDAFAAGRSADGEDLLMVALDEGLPWDVATRAAAIGVAHRFAASSAEARTLPGTLALA
jgi:hypothetical protein